MIYGTINDINRYRFLEDNIQKCFAYIKGHKLDEYEKGSYPIEDDILFFNIAEYSTKADKSNAFWEAHRRYIDLHYLLRGSERIDLGFISRLKQGDFSEKDDFLPLEGSASASVILNPGDFLICYPEDGHMTALSPAQPVQIKKAIFKIRV